MVNIVNFQKKYKITIGLLSIKVVVCVYHNVKNLKSDENLFECLKTNKVLIF